MHDPTTNMKLVQIKDKEKLNRIIENQIYHACDIIVLFEIIWSNGLVVKAVDSQYQGAMFKTTGWLQG